MPGKKKIGILAGTFDPVHAGHIAFAEQALGQFNLDKVVFLPERQPRNKNVATKIRDRVKLLKLAISDNQNFEIYDTGEPHFTLVKSLSKLQSKYPNSEFVFLVGSDVGHHIHEWKDISQFTRKISFVVAVRSGHDENEIKKEILDKLPDLKLSFMLAPQSDVSSRQVREDKAKSGLATVDNYIAEHHLYS